MKYNRGYRACSPEMFPNKPVPAVVWAVIGALLAAGVVCLLYGGVL